MIHFQLDPPREHDFVRNYSLSGRPGENFYRISVKKEPEHDSTPRGVISNYLHENLDIGKELLVNLTALTYAYVKVKFDNLA